MEGGGGGFWMDGRHTLVVVEHVSLVVPTGVVGFTDAHGVVGEIDIAVIAWFISRTVGGRRAVGEGYLQKSDWEVSRG